MKAFVVALLAAVTFGSFATAAEESTRLPSSWNRCSCSVNPSIKTATEQCESQSTNDKRRDCILEKVGVLSGNAPDLAAAEKVVDGFTATDAQKQSMKGSLKSCEAQSRHDVDKLKTCFAKNLRFRCLTDPKTVCNPRD